MYSIGTTVDFFSPEWPSVMSEARDPKVFGVRVGIDVTALLDDLTGVGVFVDELVAGLARRDDVSTTAFALSWSGRQRLPEVVPPGVAVARRPMPARLVRRAWRYMDHPQVSLLAGTVDVVHGPNFVVPPGGSAAEVVTVHDLTALHFPQMCTPDVLAWPDLLRRALRRGAWVHTVSDFVANEVREAFPEAGERVVAVANGVAHPAPTDPDADNATGRTLAGGDRFVLALGTVEPRKDLPTLVRAFDAVAGNDPEVRLVVAGAPGLASKDLQRAIDAAYHRERIIRLGRIDDQQRRALLRAASVVAYPSRYEGFGLVPLEAMAAGTPVVATSVGAIPDVVGGAARLVPAGDVDALGTALEDVLNNDAIAKQLIRRGTARVDLFSWDSTVEGLVALYRHVASTRS